MQLKHFLENYRFCRKSGNDAYRRGRSCYSDYYDALRTKIYMEPTPHWKSTEVLPKPLDPTLAPIISNLANDRVRLKFSNLVQKLFRAKNSSSLYSNLILKLHLVYELNNWPRNASNNFTLKNCVFGTVKLIRNATKGKFICKVQGKTFDGAGAWSFSNYFARNIVTFGVDNTSSSHTD